MNNIDKFAPFRLKMQEAKINETAINTFENYYNQLIAGKSGLISSAEAQPVSNISHINEFERYESTGQKNLNKVAVIKLNGGLGTSMGLSCAKSLLKVRNDESFLDITVKQILNMRRDLNINIPLIFMNSFSTDGDTKMALKKYPELANNQNISTTFTENKVLKIDAKTYQPAEWPKEPKHEWSPPGHGDIYLALLESGMLDNLLRKGYEYVFVSNSDNLGAVIDTGLVGYMVEENASFLMEVANRTEADKKGGHLAKSTNGHLMLREVAQCPEDEIDQFQDITRYKYFNTNNIWFHIPTLKKILTEQNGFINLPLIKNNKFVDPTDKSSPKVHQLETAMGSAINIFPNSHAVNVERDRFIPVKKTTDLLVIRSDNYKLENDYHLNLNMVDRLEKPTNVDLDDEFYKMVGDLEERFPYDPPSLRACESFSVKGNVLFGKNIVIKGIVEIKNEDEKQMEIADGSVLEG